MTRTIVAAMLIAAFGISAAQASGRSKDERAAFWQTMHESKQPWRPAQAPVGAQSTKASAPAAAASTGVKAPAAKPAQ